MKPIKKANELANKFITKSVFDMTDEELKEQRKQGKSFAIICVDEIINAFNFPKYNGDPETEINGDEIYWIDVKHEISLL
jgi:hypothetical protein